MLTEDVLNIRCIDDESMQELQNCLYKIKPYQRYAKEKKKIPLEMLEKLINKITAEYEVVEQWYSRTQAPEEDLQYWTTTIKETITHKRIITVHAGGIYELTAKLAFALFALHKGWRSDLMKKEDIPRIITKEQAILTKGKLKRED